MQEFRAVKVGLKGLKGFRKGNLIKGFHLLLSGSEFQSINIKA